MTIDSPKEEGEFIVVSTVNHFTSDICFKIDRIWVVTDTSTPVKLVISGGLYHSRFRYETVVATDVHPDFSRAEVPMKGTPADVYTLGIQTISATVTSKDHHSVRMRVAVKFDSSVECEKEERAILGPLG